MKRIIDSTLVILSLMLIFGCKEVRWGRETLPKTACLLTPITSDKKIGNAVRSLFSFLLLPDAEVLEDVV